MRKSIKEIYSAFGGKLVGSKLMQRQVCAVLSLMDEKIIYFVTINCWFFSSMDDAWAFTFTGNDLKDKHLVILSDELLMQSEQQIRHTIAHEIGHVVLGHKNSILRKQSRGEIRRQEKEADIFARRYVNSL